MESIVDGVNVDIVEKIALGLCAFHTFKTGISSAPCPAFWQFKRYFIADIFDLAANLLIIRVILTFEDDRFLLVTLDLALFDEIFFLCPDAFQKNRSRLIIRVLRYKFASNGKVENLGFGLRNKLYGFNLSNLDSIHHGHYFVKVLAKPFLLIVWRKRNENGVHVILRHLRLSRPCHIFFQADCVDIEA